MNTKITNKDNFQFENDGSALAIKTVKLIERTFNGDCKYYGYYKGLSFAKKSSIHEELEHTISVEEAYSLLTGYTIDHYSLTF